MCIGLSCCACMSTFCVLCDCRFAYACFLFAHSFATLSYIIYHWRFAYPCLPFCLLVFFLRLCSLSFCVRMSAFLPILFTALFTVVLRTHACLFAYSFCGSVHCRCFVCACLTFCISVWRCLSPQSKDKWRQCHTRLFLLYCGSWSLDVVSPVLISAIALSRQGHSITILERARDEQFPMQGFHYYWAYNEEV